MSRALRASDGRPVGDLLNDQVNALNRANDLLERLVEHERRTEGLEKRP